MDRPSNPADALLSTLGVVRIGIGLAALVAPRLARVALPTAADTVDGRAAVRMLGARDLALGVATLAAARRGGVRVVALATILSDSADAAVSTRSSAPPLRRVATVASGIGGAVLTALAVARLGEDDEALVQG